MQEMDDTLAGSCDTHLYCSSRATPGWTEQHLFSLEKWLMAGTVYGMQHETGASPVERRKYSKDNGDTSQDQGKPVWVALTGHIWDKLNIGTKFS